MRTAPILLLYVLYASPAMACRCTEPTPNTAYKRADAVASVKLIEVSAPAADGTVFAKAEVKDVWKTEVPERIQIVTGEDCAYPLVTGREYLLYLYAGANGTYGTYRCRGNRELAQSGPALKWLGKHGRRIR